MLEIYLVCFWFLSGAVTGIYVIKTDNGAVKIRDLPFIASFTALGLASVISLVFDWLENKITDEQLEKFLNKKIF